MPLDPLRNELPTPWMAWSDEQRRGKKNFTIIEHIAETKLREVPLVMHGTTPMFLKIDVTADDTQFSSILGILD